MQSFSEFQNVPLSLTSTQTINTNSSFDFAELLQGYQSWRDVYQVFTCWTWHIFRWCIHMLYGHVCVCVWTCVYICVYMFVQFHNLTRDYKSSTELMSKSMESVHGLTSEREREREIGLMEGEVEKWRKARWWQGERGIINIISDVWIWAQFCVWSLTFACQ